MRSLASVVLFVCFALFETCYARVPQICKTEDGITGHCVPLNLCPKIIKYVQNNCSEANSVCCALSVSEKIVTDLTGTTNSPPGNADTNAPAPPTAAPIPSENNNPIVFPTEPSHIPTAPPPPTVVTVPVENKDNDVNLPLYQKKCAEYHAQPAQNPNGPKLFVVGGTNSASKEFPHMAALGFGDQSDIQWLCGGSLISEKFVVTAAHCISSSILGEVKYVKLGTNNLQESGEEFTVVRKISNPAFQSPSQYNDIALLELDRPAKFSDYIRPICLQDDTDLSAQKMIATGWGKTDFNGNSSPILKKVDLEYFSSAVCQETYQKVSADELPNGIDDATQVCAGSTTEQKDTCQGDSGGPLQINKNGRLNLVGLTSFGIGCGTVNRPGVYTKVSHYIPWIEENIWQ